MKRKKPSVASQVVSQARGKTAVTSLDDARLNRTTILRGIDPDSGAAYVKAVFPNLVGLVEIDLSFLLQFPSLDEPFSEGYRQWAATVELGSKQAVATDLARYFFAFLAENDLFELDLAALNRPLFLSYISWLDHRHANGSEQLLAVGTRKQALASVRGVIGGLTKNRTWGAAARSVKHAIPDGVWPGSHLKATPKTQLDLDHMRKIVRAAEAEVEEIRLRFEGRDALIAAGREALKIGRRRGDLASFLAIVAEQYPTLIPSQSELKKIDPPLGNEMQAIHSQRGVTKYFYAGSRDLVPFIILISAATAFNPETVLRLEWANVRPETRFNLPVVTFIGEKGRAEEDQVVLDGDSGGFGMTTILQTLLRITERLRPHLAHPGDRDRLFVFAQERGTVAPKAFRHNSTDLAVSDSSLRHSRLRFIADHGLEIFTFDQFRTTLLDAAHRWTGDLRVVTSLGRHRRAHTGWLHYNSSRAKAGYRERVGETIVLRERWYESEGKIDPRGLRLTTRMDRGAATPGFICLDPHDSPRPNQTSGRLCSAYGECPACPLAGANVGDSASVAYYLALRASIYEAQGRIAPPVWVARWSPVVEALDDLLHHVPTATHTEAAKLDVTLPSVG